MKSILILIACCFATGLAIAVWADDSHAGHDSKTERTQAEHAGHGNDPHAAHGGAAHDAIPAPPSPHSIFQLDSVWTTAGGKSVELSDMGGRVLVLAMVYTHCEHACPRIIADMRALRAALGDAGGRVGYALVSIDPDRDDVERLRSFAEKTGLGRDWTLLRGDDGAVRELAAVLGVRYRRISESDFIHSNLLSVIDPQGVIVHRQVGLGVDPKESARVIQGLLEAGD